MVVAGTSDYARPEGEQQFTNGGEMEKMPALQRRVGSERRP